MKLFSLFCLTGLLVILYGCIPETDPTFPPAGTASQLPHEIKGYLTIESSLINQTANISKVEFVDTIGSFIYLKLTFKIENYTAGVYIKCNGPGFYPFHFPVSTGESYVYTWPNCGLDSDLGGYGVASINNIDVGVDVLYFNSNGIEGVYQGEFLRCGVFDNCDAWPLDTFTVSGAFKTTF